MRPRGQRKDGWHYSGSHPWHRGRLRPGWDQASASSRAPPRPPQELQQEDGKHAHIQPVEVEPGFPFSQLRVGCAACRVRKG
jgi:hypothetical protein